MQDDNSLFVSNQLVSDSPSDSQTSNPPSTEGDSQPIEGESNASPGSVEEDATNDSATPSAEQTSQFNAKNNDKQEDGNDYEDEDENDDEEEGEEKTSQFDKTERVEEKREPISLVFIGHVDAGKSTMAGNILFQTNQVDERTIQKYKDAAEKLGRASWLYAFVIDTNEEERAKGKTVEVGRAHFSTNKKRFTILDAPGHKDYVPNMIGGAAQADIAILVISARIGEFETGFKLGGQTQEHATLVKMLGVGKIVVAINKMDDPSVEWSQERYEEIKSELLPFLTKPSKKSQAKTEHGPSLQFDPSDLTWVPVSGFTGANVIERIGTDVCPWYDGPSLLECLDNLPPIQRNLDGPLRIPILGSYKEAGYVHVLGKVESGKITEGQTIMIMPNQSTLNVTFVQLDTGEMVSSAAAGENVRIGLKDISVKQVQQGFVVCEKTDRIPLSDSIIAQISIIDLPPSTLFSAGYSANIHIHNCVEECFVDEITSIMDRKARKWVKPRPFSKVGDVIKVRLKISRVVPLERFEDFNQLGRFTLRLNKHTIAIGKVLKTC